MRTKGFSLIEMLIVLILISLSISLVAPSFSRLSKTIELKGVTQKVSGILRYCRSEAVNKGKDYQVLFDSDMGEVKVQPVVSEEEEKKEPIQSYPLPKGIHLRGGHPIEFYSNGSSNGGTILLESEGHKGYKITVHFLTGMVEVEKVEG
jgi:general secretion pathway protein H